MFQHNHFFSSIYSKNFKYPSIRYEILVKLLKRKPRIWNSNLDGNEKCKGWESIDEFFGEGVQPPKYHERTQPLGTYRML